MSWIPPHLPGTGYLPEEATPDFDDEESFYETIEYEED